MTNPCVIYSAHAFKELFRLASAGALTRAEIMAQQSGISESQSVFASPSVLVQVSEVHHHPPALA